MARISPAQQHYQRTVAAMAAAKAGQGEVVQGDDYKMMLAKLVSDRQRLKLIQSVQRKIEVKRDILPEYQAWIDGVLAEGKGAEDTVLTTVMVWHIDTGDFKRALQIGDYVLKHKMALPDQYNRNAATLLQDEISDAFLQGMKIDDAEQILHDVERMTADHDTPDQARAKLYKALAYAITAQTGDNELAADLLPKAQEALNYLQKALQLFANIGVKKDIEKLERRIKNATPA